jgi:nucleotide-binding universal stress UspA family protein
VGAQMNANPPPAPPVRIVVGYDGSPPADRALDAAARLLEGRTGRITVTYVGHISSTAMLSADAIAEIENDFDEVERELRASAGKRLRGQADNWDFERRQGQIAHELVAAADEIRSAHPDDTVVIVVGSSSSAVHRMVGSVPVNLARHSPFYLVIVP